MLAREGHSSGIPKILNSSQLIAFISNTQGCILATTRDRGIGEKLMSRNACITIPAMSVLEVEKLLYDQVPGGQKDQPMDATELLHYLGYLPLAVTRAASLMNENPCHSTII